MKSSKRNAIKQFIDQHPDFKNAIAAMVLDSIENTDDFAKQQAEKHNSKIADQAEKVFNHYIKSGATEQQAQERKALYLKNNLRHYSSFK